MIEHHVTVSIDGDRIKATDIRTRAEAIEFITNAIDRLAPDIEGIGFHVEKKTAHTDHEHCVANGSCWQTREACPAGAPAPPMALTNLEAIHGPSARLGDWRNDS